MGLSWKNINFGTGVITINRTILYSAKKGIYESTTKTTSSERSLKIPEATLNMLKIHKENQDKLKEAQGDRWKETGYVFSQDDGAAMHPDSITTWLARLPERHKELDFHINPHAFRHTMASILISEGIDIARVSAFLGHSSIRTTLSTYIHIINEHTASKQTTAIGDIVMGRIADP